MAESTQFDPKAVLEKARADLALRGEGAHTQSGYKGDLPSNHLGIAISGRGKTNDSKSVLLAAKEQLLRMVAEGMPIDVCARTLQRSPITILRWTNDPEFRERLKELNADAYADIDAEIKMRAMQTRERLTAAADEALDQMIALMRNADSETIKFRASQDLLDRNSETSKIQRVDKRVTKVNIDVKWLQNAATAAAEEGGPIVDVPVETQLPG